MVGEDESGEVVAWASAPPYRRDQPAYSGVADFSIYVARAARGRGAGRATLKAPDPLYTTGVLAKYARLVTGADRGAITEP